MIKSYKTHLSLLCVSLMAVLCMYYHTGPAANGQAVTGAPFNGGTYCNSCHGGGTYNTIVSMQLLDASLNPVTSYTAGTSYTLKITLTGTGTSSATRYGFQVTSAYSDANNTNYNGWGSSLPVNTHNTLLNSRNYIEHSTQLSSNVISIPWTAPTTANSNNIVFYAAGNIVNNDGATTGDSPNTTTLTITAPCTITLSPVTLSNGTIGTAYNQTISQTGGSGTYTYSITSGSLPAGLSLSSTGTLSGTPTTAGTYNFTIAATNGSNCNGSQNYSIVISCPVIVLTPATISNMNAGSTVNQTISQTGGNGTFTYTVTSGTLPTGLTLSSGGILSGTPTTTGSYSFTITAANSNGCSGLGNYTVSVICPAITITPGSLPNVSTGASYTHTISQTGSNGAFTYAITSGSLPIGITLAPDGTLSGTATASGTYTFTVTGTNQYSCSSSKSYTITVACPSITLNASLYNGNIGIPYYQTISQTGGSGASTYAVTSGTLPSGLTLASDGTLSGTPGTNGTYNFTVTATDGFGCTGSQVYTIMITCPNISLSPTTIANANIGTSFNQSITQTGGSGAVTYTVSAGSLPQGLTLSPGGLLSGTATANGTYNFTITATDAHSCTGSQPYTIIISCPNISLSPTTIAGATTNTLFNQTITQAGGSGTITYTVSAGTLPTGLTLSTGGVLSGIATTSGTYNFTVTATDAHSCTGSQSYIVNIGCPNLTISPATIADANVGSPYNISFTTAGTSVITYTLSAGALPTGLSLASNGTLSGNATGTGTYLFTITATDSSSGCFNSQTYTVNITCPAITLSPAALPDTFLGSSYNQTITSSGGAGTITYTVTNGNLPTGLSLNANGTLSGTATAAGTYSFTVTGTDSFGCAGTEAYNISVSCPTITLSPGSLSNGIVGTTYSEAVAATGGTGTTTLTISGGTIPTGMTFSGDTLSGIPVSTGTYNFTILATDAWGCTATQPYNVTISCPAITLSPATLPAGNENNVYNQSIAETGSTGSTFTYTVSAGTLPAGLSLSSAGVLSGTPITQGVYNFTLTMTDNYGCTLAEPYTITIEPPLSIKAISSADKDISIISLLPNVVTNTTTAQIICNKQCTTDIIVIDMAGRLLFKDHVKLHTGTNNLQYDFSILKAGFYLFQVSANNDRPIKFVKL